MPSPIPKSELERFDCTLRVDDRSGSKDLVGPLARLGVDTRLERLVAGDIEIIGIDGTVVLVEYKKWRDVLTCIRSGRFAEQLRRMRREAHVSWLLIEGRVRVGDSGKLEVMGDRGWRKADGGFTYQEVAAWLMTMTQCGGALVHQTSCEQESAIWLRALYYWWSFQAWEEHRAHLAWFEPPPLWENPYAEPPLALKLACMLPGIGSTRATAILDRMGNEDEYPSALEVIEATTSRLESVEGIGKVTARKVWDGVRKRERRLTRRSRAEKDARRK